MNAKEQEQHSENEYSGSLCWRKLKTGYVITSEGRVEPSCRTSNSIDNRKYSLLSFVPVILYHQFSFFFNLYFLFLCITQFVPQFKVGFTITYVGPLIFVLTLTMAKEAWDEYKQYVRDRNLNSTLFKKLASDGTHRSIQSKNIKVGDVLYLEKGDRVPADLVVLATKNDSGVIYLKTDQLDGETDWKLRESVKGIQSRVSGGSSVQEIKYQVEVLRPTNKIYEFRGTAQIEDDPHAEGLRLQHTAWASTTVASGEFYGLVIYVGKDTRIQMNGNEARVKFPMCDYEINTISKFLFGFCLACSLFLVALKGFTKGWTIQWIQFLVLLCCLIPQSLRTNLDVVKLIYAYRINKDSDIPGTVCKNSQITEDLGRVSFLLSDKTGTLTQNNMLFRKLSTGTVQYTEEDLGEIKKAAKEAKLTAEVAGSKRQHELSLFLHCILLCHSVQPCVDSAGKRFLQSASPDEIALVEFCESLGWKLESRDRTTMEVITPKGERVQVEILECFPFSSARKRMGILLKLQEPDSPLLYMLKGADSVVAGKVGKKGDILVEEADNLAREGLRTLAFAYKWVSAGEYGQWKEKMNRVKAAIDASEEEEDRVVSELESDMLFAGISGVEDLLQEQVRDTIESLREGGVRVWVLTGDKVETAKCIAKATGLKQKQENFFEMLEEDPVKIETQIYQLASRRDVLVIQGSTLASVYEHGLEQNFFNNIQQLHAVMFCRCSPTQKAQIVRSVQKATGLVVAAIGDGGNDVSMIQQAEVGIGIEGKEGLQAAMSADFSVLKFKFVKDLLFWHGRRATLSTAYVTLFVIHRGLIIAMIQFCFSLFFYFVAVSFYNLL